MDIMEMVMNKCFASSVGRLVSCSYRELVLPVERCT